MTDVATRLARVSLRSSDVDRAAAWYCRVFGFRETASTTAPPRDSVLLRLVDGAAGCATELELGTMVQLVIEARLRNWSTTWRSLWRTCRQATSSRSIWVVLH